MEKHVQLYVEALNGDLLHYEDLQAKALRKIDIIKRKLANPERAFNKELKDGSLKVKKIMGVEVPQKRSNLPGVAGPVLQVEQEKPKKSLWEKLTTEDE